MFLSVAKGVPHGSVMGRVLFITDISNTVLSLTECHAHLYEDYTILSCFADSVQLVIENFLVVVFKMHLKQANQMLLS